MQTALGLAGAPPATGALIFTIEDRFGARPAADRRISLVLQRVHDHVVVGHVAGDVFVGPCRQWAHLDEPALVDEPPPLGLVKWIRTLMPGADPAKRTGMSPPPAS